MKTVDQYLYGVVQAQNEDEPAEVDGAVNRSNSNLEESKSNQAESEGSFVDDGAPKDDKENNKSEQQMIEEIAVLPNAFIPIVLNPKFEFVPFESSANKRAGGGEATPQQENRLNIQNIDVHNLTHTQTRDPP